MEVEFLEQDKIKTWIPLGKMNNGTYSQIECEIPISFLECMPLYKWQYCHEVLLKNEGYCDLIFNEFIEELDEHLICADRLIKLNCLDKLERKDLITLFEKQLQKNKMFNNSIREKEFLQAVEELKTNK